jgi:hypothetical protein
MGDLTPREPHRPLRWPDFVERLQDILAENAQPIYIVGGAVRDALLERQLTDLDLAVAKDAIPLARRIANALRGDFFVLDAERDVGRVLVDTPDGRFMIDVARFRGDDLLADLNDRDFTINAMAVDLTADINLLIDPLNGERDLRDKLVRQCNPHAFARDPLRALRAVRQSVQFGMRLERDTLNDMRAVKAGLRQISPERIRDELVKLLALTNARGALRVAESLGLLDDILPEVVRLRTVLLDNPEYANRLQETLAIVEKLFNVFVVISPQRTDHSGANFAIGMLVMQMDRYRRRLQEHVGHLWPNDRPHTALLVLAALLRDCTPDEAGARAQALRLSNGERDRLTAVVRYYDLPLKMKDLSPLEIHRFWRQTGVAGVDVCLLAAANYLGVSGSKLDQDGWLQVVERLLMLLHAYYERYDELVEPPVLLDGNQLMSQLGLARGPMIGTLLERIREAQVTGEVRSVEDALQLARAALNENQSR